MQAILIMLPILVYALLTGLLLAWVFFVALPRLRRRSGKQGTSKSPRVP